VVAVAVLKFLMVLLEVQAAVLALVQEELLAQALARKVLLVD
jgi:hypothetical protein